MTEPDAPASPLRTVPRAEPGPRLPSSFTTLGDEFLADPYALYERLRSADPVLWVPGIFGLGAWLVTSHALVSTVLRSKNFGREGSKVVPSEKLALFPQGAAGLADRRRSMLFHDPPDHTRLRGLVSRAFTPSTVEELRHHIAEIAEDLLDRVEGQGYMDLLRDFAFPLPIIVIAELLGVPPEDRDRIKCWATDIIASTNPMPSPDESARAEQAVYALDEYVEGIVEERRRAPRADLISQLTQVHDAGDRLSTMELLSTCRLLLTAGHETTTHLIGNGMLAIHRHPAARDTLLTDPELLPQAIEELLRYDSPVQLTMRFAMEDEPLGQHVVKRGDLVVPVLGAANRDPEHFPAPDDLDLLRGNAHTHVSFGAGIHCCLGASLARLEGQVALGALMRRLPQLALGTEPPVWRKNWALRGLTSLPMTF